MKLGGARPGQVLSTKMATGFIDQALSSATNLGLTLFAGRVLGPEGLGSVFVGFTVYLVALGFQRGLITDPLVTSGSHSSSVDKQYSTEAALGVVALWSLGMTCGTIVLGLVIGGPVGRGIFLFAPWLAAALLQDFWRVILFRDGRGSAAVANDSVWVGLMIILAIALRNSSSDWAVMVPWGTGAWLGCLVGFVQVRSHVAAPSRSASWWRRDAWPLGKWLGAESIAYTAGAYGTILVIAFALPVGVLGGLRAVQAIFAPLSLLSAAIALPGLPALTAAAHRSQSEARQLALRIGVMAVALTAGYVLLAGTIGRSLLPSLFGDAFSRYEAYILPIGFGQVVAATSIGFGLVLKAERRGRVILANRVVGSFLTLAVTWALTAIAGGEGAAWGLAIGSAFMACLTIASVEWHRVGPSVAPRLSSQASGS